MLAGQCWLTLDGSAPVRLAQGDFVLLPATPAFTMSSAPDLNCIDSEPSDTAVRHGDQAGQAEVAMLGGAFRIEPINAALLLTLMPRMIHVRAGASEAGRLAELVALMMDESAAERPGREMILERLLEVMLLECLRHSGLGEDAVPPGLIAGLGDPGLARALRALHGDVRGNWTVAALAELAGMSRSAFAARFSDRLGCAPMEYLARWRIAIARDALKRGGKPLAQIADEIGFESASAFSTAFRRRVGCAPGAFSRAQVGMREQLKKDFCPPASNYRTVSVDEVIARNLGSGE